MKPPVDDRADGSEGALVPHPIKVETRGIPTMPALARPLILMKVLLSMGMFDGKITYRSCHNSTRTVGVGSIEAAAVCCSQGYLS